MFRNVIIQNTNMPRLCLVSLLLSTYISGMSSGGKTPDPDWCPPDTYLGKRPDDTWDCLFCTRTCPPGTEEEAPCTKERDLQCRDCPDGTYNNGPTTKCRNCTVCLQTSMVTKCYPTSDTVCKEDTSSSSWIWIVVSVVAACVIILIIIGVLIRRYRQGKKRKNARVQYRRANPEDYITRI